MPDPIAKYAAASAAHAHSAAGFDKKAEEAKLAAQSAAALASQKAASVLTDLSALSSRVDGKSDLGHGHAADEVTGLGTGKHTVFWPGDAIKTAATAGCTASQETEIANKPPVSGADFDPATEQYGRLCAAIPRSADGGAIDVMLIWNNPGTGSGGVVSSVRAAYLSPGVARPDWSGWVELGAVTLTTQAMDVATGYASLTPGGTAANEAILMLELRRKAADAGDTLAVAARCTGAFLRFSINASTDA